MNLLSHFVCAAHFPPEARLGSGLPDLLPLFNRELRIHPLADHWRKQTQLDAPMLALLEGIRYHQYVDAKFHPHSLFRRFSAALKGVLRGAGGGEGMRYFFAAHILTEIYFDHLLMGLDTQLTADFYRQFSPQAIDLLVRFAQAHPSVEGPALRRFLEDVPVTRFLERYSTAEGMLKSANNVLRMMSQRRMTQGEEQAVMAHLASRHHHNPHALLAFIAAMQAAPGFQGVATPVTLNSPSVTGHPQAS